MAELASGAVTSLLGVIRNEWRLLGRVGGDVQFIREEMESMSSFLMHLARTVPPGGEHDEQVRTWMNQVRVLAHDCNNCIDLYLYRGNPDIHLGRDRLRRYLRWVPWFLQKMLAQHRAALELSVLKERARDVGKRRLRYGVEVPKKAATPLGPVPAGAAPPALGGAQGSREAAALVHVDDGGEDGGHDQVWATATATDATGRIRRVLFGLYVREDYFNDLLAEWIRQARAQPHWRAPDSQGRHDTRCVAFVVPSTESGDIARQAKAEAEKHVKNTILVDIPALHIWSMLGPKNILYYILREIELKQQQEADAKSQTQPQQQQGQGIDKWSVRTEKRKRIREIKTEVQKLKVIEKIDEIRTRIEKVKDNNMKLQPYLTKPAKKEDYITKDKISNHDFAELLVLLLMPSSAAADQMDEKNIHRLAEHYDFIIEKAAEKLKQHMEQVNTGQQRIIHNVAQYAHILHEVFPKTVSSTSQPQPAQEQDTGQATTEATPGKIQIREIIDKVKQEILSEVFMEIGNKGQEATKTDTGTTTTAIGDKGQQEATKTNTTTTTLDEAQVKKWIQEAIQQLNEEKPAEKKQGTVVSGGQGPTTEAHTKEPDTASKVEEATKKTGEILGPTIKETTERMMKYYVRWRMIKRQMDINGIVANIQKHLKRDEETLIILKVDEKYVSQWEQARSALSLLPCIAVVMILTKTETNLKRAKEEYNYPKGEPIDYSSRAARYHGIVLEITGLQKSEYNDDAKILRTILDKCDSNELCMKIFAHALYAKPKRSKEELHRLHNNLQMLPQKSYHSIAMKMFKFSYRDMPKEYQSCLLYLAIFPQGHKIRRSTVIGRWVAERIITTEDWRWSSSVHIAEQCFDALVTRGLVYSAEISATGRVKSCIVGDLAYDFITKMAKKQRIVEPRLSHHLARYFSIFSDLHLRVSDKINDFMERLSGSSQWPRLKVLDLEGCRCFKNNRQYLRNICNKIVLLKYLSLRGTDVNWLPREINNLHELEVLDIQKTEVPKSFTRDLLLLKLKRLLAGNKNPSPHDHVLVPGKIEKMQDMEVLSNVKAKSDQDFDDIGKLWQLRKLGVVINIKDKHTHLKNLLKAISNLHECLQSLSITLDATSHKGAPSRDSREPKDSPMVLDNKIEEYPKVLERLSISGNIHFLPSVLTDKNTPLIKLTLSNTLLRQENLVDLANLHMLRCLKLRHNTYTDNKLTFKEVQFKKLEYFLVEGSNWIEISFEEDTAAPELEKIVLSFDNIESIAGVHHLKKLEELFLKKKLEELELNKYNKGSSNSGGITDTTTTNRVPSAPADTSVASPSTLPLNANGPAVVPSTATGTEPTTSAPTGGAANPSPSPLTASTSAVGNNHVPSTPAVRNPDPNTTNNTTVDTVNPSPSNQTTSTNNSLIPKLLSDAKQVSKVTLCGTMLKQGDLRKLAGMENIRCLVLLHGSYGERQLDLNKGEFPRLSVLIVSCSMVTEIKFESESSPKLEKIVWTFETMDSFSGIGNLTRLKELELIGASLPDKVKEDIDKHKDTIHCTYYKPESPDQTVRSPEKGDSVPRLLHIWNDQVWRRRRN